MDGDYRIQMIQKYQAVEKSLGADTVIDYTKENTLNPGEQYDFILDAVGKIRTSKLKDANQRVGRSRTHKTSY